MIKGPNTHQISLVGTINVTPFVDVLLVLLALTIVFASDLPSQKNVEEGTIAGALGGEFEDSDTVILEIAADGTMALAGEIIDTAAIPETLERLSQERQRNIVVNVSSHHQVGYETVFGVLQVINNSSAAGLTFSIYE
jgi:biopolymer transport protein ExbD